MTLDVDQEILQDFVVEAGEILEQLSEQLVELEMQPADADLLNAIFRGFHTVKGGAGFLALNAMVDICHVSENVFDILRNNQRAVDADLMDVVLQALDEVNRMFDQVRANELPTDASKELLNKLEKLAVPQDDADATSTAADSDEAMSEQVSESAEDNAVIMTETPPSETVTSEEATENEDADTDEITYDEFEALLDSLHEPKSSGETSKKTQSTKKDATDESESDTDDLIQENEFEALLDTIHGKGKGPGKEPEKEQENSNTVKKPDNEKTSAAKGKLNELSAEKPALKKNADSPQPVEATVRVDTSRLDDIMNMVGELVLVRNRLVKLGATLSDENLVQAVSNLDVVTADLQMAVMKTRMQPIKKVFGRFPRVVRDLARSLKKDIVLETKGEDTDLDKNLVEALADPLVHLVRNSVDHGIEDPSDRELSGKSRTGNITLSAEQAGDHILLTIEDDGAGMDPDKLRNIAISKNLMDEDAASRLTDKECFNLIFMPGFSTKQEISDISGRGVGMDVVKTKISQLNGTVDIDSMLGKGTCLNIKVPLTLAILPTLMVVLGDQTFALPLTNVNEIFHLDLTNTNVVDGQLVVILRNKAVPLFYLNKWLVPSDDTDKNYDKSHVVIVTVGTKKVGFVVDQLVGQEEVVIKPLGCMLQGTPGMAGATITGDGNIAMILDIPGLLRQYARKHA